MPVPQFLEEGPFLQGGRRESPVLRVSCVQVNIRAPRMLLPAPHPSATSSALVSPCSPRAITPNHSRAGTFPWRRIRIAGVSLGWPGSERSCASSFPLWTLRCRILPLELVFLSKSGWVCAALSDNAPRERVHPHSKLRPLPVQAEDSDGF